MSRSRIARAAYASLAGLITLALAACGSERPEPAAKAAAETEGGPPAGRLPADLPLWAYGYKAFPEAVVDYRARCATAPATTCIRGTAPKDTTGELKRLKGSDQTFTLTQIWDSWTPVDWFPEDHPPMPPIVARGRKAAGVYPCSGCHLPNGMGLMQNGAVAGLPKEYILQQLRDFRAGRRQSTDVNKANASVMRAIARDLTDAEMEQAADYFSKLKAQPWIRVVETDTVPTFRASINGLYTRDGDATEPLGRRLIEMPEDTEQTRVLRNPRSGYVAYAPVGSLAHGRRLAETGQAPDAAGKLQTRSVPCAGCHGEGLRGGPLGPPIAGRPPSYLARQMFDIKSGSRRGEQAEAMLPTVENMTEDDLVAVVAYVSSLKP